MPGPLTTPPIAHLDTVRDAELEAEPGFIRYVRTGYVDNIDLTDVPDPDALLKVRPYLPAWNSSLSTRSPGMLLRRVRVRPEEGKFTRARVWLTYETGSTDFTPTIYTIRDRSFSINKHTCLVPGTRSLVTVGFDPSGLNAEVQGLAMMREPLYFDVNVTARSIQITSLMYGRPDTTTTTNPADYVNYVNDATWPTSDYTNPNNGFSGPITTIHTAKGLPMGYWRLNSYGADMNVTSGMTLVQAEAVTQVLEDWSLVGILRNEVTGRYPFPAIEPPSAQLAILTAMLNRDYSYGIIYPINADKQRGITRFGPYPLVSFPTLFGF